MKQDWDEYQSTLPMTLEQQRKIAHLYARIVFYGGYGILNMLDEGIMFEERDDIVSYHWEGDNMSKKKLSGWEFYEREETETQPLVPIIISVLTLIGVCIFLGATALWTRWVHVV